MTHVSQSQRAGTARRSFLIWVCLAISASSLLSGCRPDASVPSSQAATGATTEAATNAAIGAVAAKFSDVTAAAGLAFIQHDGGCGRRYFVEQVCAGAALLDANGDGNLDVYFPQPKPLGVCKYAQPLRQRLYLNDGKGHFRLAAGAFGGTDTEHGIAAAVGDYDNDGHEDLYVCCYGRNTLYHNRGDGTFEDVTRQAGVGLDGFSTDAVWFDYDGDGYLDLYVCRYCKWTVATNVTCWSNGKPDTCDPSTYPPTTSVLYHNNGDGTFTNVTAHALPGQASGRSLGVAAADFNHDGRLDLFVANDITPNFLYLNRGDGTFQEVAMVQNVAFGLSGKAQANMGVAVGDYDEDGDLDVLVTTFANEPYTLYRNDNGFFTDVTNTAGLFQPTLPLLGFGTGFFDALNRGRLDLFFANGHISPYMPLRFEGQSYKQKNLLMLNDGHGKFVEDPDALPKDDVRVHRGVCFGDINNDGRVDILVTAEDDRPTLLRNDSTAGHWLLLRLTDKHGCSTPIGTRCVATIGGQKRLRVVLGGGSYGGSSDYRVHFGLGAATEVERLEIHWMSGRVQVLEHIRADRILAVREPA